MKHLTDAQKDGFLYLAQPYSDPSRITRGYRYWAALMASAILMKKGYTVFSPIAHGHRISSLLGPQAMGYDRWKILDEAVIKSPACKGLVILKLDGWKESEGLENEVYRAQAQDISIHYMAEAELEAATK